PRMQEAANDPSPAPSITDEAARPAARAPVTSNPDAYKINASDPAAPKRGGWWARAKQAISGE
ncbi:MAG: hypothetical protein ABWZ80_03070, partial [Beijerinckiaceae bacterium]